MQTFRIQKAVRKIKKPAKHTEEDQSAERDQSTIDKLAKELEKGNQQKQKLDTITKEHLKILTIYLMEDLLNISFDKDVAYFEKEIPEFKEKVKSFKESDEEWVKNAQWLYQLSKPHRQFRDTIDHVKLIVDKKEVTKERNRNKRLNKKEKKILKKQQEEIANEIKQKNKPAQESEDESADADADEVEDKDKEQSEASDAESEENVKVKVKEVPKTKTQMKKDKKAQKEKEKLTKQTQNNEKEKENGPEARAHFKDRKSNIQNKPQKEKPNKPQNNQRNNRFENKTNDKRKNSKPLDSSRSKSRGPQNKKVKTDAKDKKAEKPKKPSNPRNKFLPVDELHPSWKARIDEKKGAFIKQFQGTRVKL